MPYFNQEDLLREHFQRFSNYSADARAHIEIIIVDDGSQVIPAQKVFEDAKKAKELPDTKLAIVTLLEDIGFNHGGACNTGAKVARGNHLLFVDPDHWFDPDMMDRVLVKARQLPKEKHFASGFTHIDDKWAYNPELPSMLIGNPKLNEFTQKHMAGSPNVIIIPREFFWKTGGYDEDLAGNWGYEDNQYFACLDHNFHAPVGTFRWEMGKGMWVVYRADEDDEKEEKNFKRTDNTNFLKWKAKTRQHIWCNKGEVARVPYAVTGKHKW